MIPFPHDMEPLNDTAPEVVLVECPMCHWRVPEADLTSFLKRRVCTGCAGTWFEDDDPEDDDKK